MADEETSTLDQTTEPDSSSNGTKQESTKPRARRKLLLLGIPVVLILVGGFGIWWFLLRDDSPPPASIGGAREALDERESGESDAAGTDVAGDAIEGTWVVDPAVVPPDEGEAFAGYRIQEELATVGAAEAVGRTPDVSGEITVEGDQVTAAEFEVDMTTLESDEGFRDNRLRDSGLETNTYPTSSFTLTEPLDLPDDATSGDELTYEAVGELDLHGVTREITVELDAFLDGDVMVIVASAPIALADYDIEKPSAPSVVSIRDEGRFELQVFLTRG